MAKPASFVKGDPRINRNGAPKKEWTMSGLIREALEEQDATGTLKRKVIADKLASLAIKGDMIAIKEVNNRLDGMPKQDIKQETTLNVFFDPSLKQDE